MFINEHQPLKFFYCEKLDYVKAAVLNFSEAAMKLSSRNALLKTFGNFQWKYSI